MTTIREELDALTEYAKEYCTRRELGPKSIGRNAHMNHYHGHEPSKELVDAVVADFINFVAFKHGVDFALYSCDINSEEDCPKRGATRSSPSWWQRLLGRH